MIYDDAHVQLYLRVRVGNTVHSVPALPEVELFANRVLYDTVPIPLL